MRTILSLVSSMLLLIAGCDKLIKKKGSGSDGVTDQQAAAELDLSSTGTFLSLADFPKTDLKQASTEDALLALKNSSNVYFNSPDSSDGTGKTPLSKCLDEIPIKYKSLNKSTIGIEGEFELLNCLKNPSAEDSQDYAKYTKFSIKVVDNMHCARVDLSDMNGKTPAAIEKAIEDKFEKDCHEAETTSLLNNTTIDAQIEDNGQVIKVTTRLATVNSKGKPCQTAKSETGRRFGDCVFAEHTKKELSQEGAAAVVENDLLLLEASELTVGSDPNAQWYASGKLNVTSNNITGFLTYTSPIVAPSYTLSNGSTGISGILTLNAGNFQSESTGLSIWYLKTRLANGLKR